MANQEYKNRDWFNLKFFKLSRIKYEELWDDALGYIRQTYASAKETFNTSSPFSQLLSVILHMGRMILYYVEDSITGLNIKTAYRPDQIRGLATLTGHHPGRSVAARGSIMMSFYDDGTCDYLGQSVIIPNKIELHNNINGLTYTMLLSADAANIVLRNGNYINASIIQGQIKLQQATSNGDPLQSYNFGERNHAEVDQYYLNVYVNNEQWEIRDSYIDLAYDEKACVVNTGMNGGVDVWFGDGFKGHIPEKGATIKVEYVSSVGVGGSMLKSIANSADAWKFQGKGFLKDGTTFDLNKYFKITCSSDIVFGTEAENIKLTQLLAPYSSRSMVLANEDNYLYFFRKMNMFSCIDIQMGYNTIEDYNARVNYEMAVKEMQNANAHYTEAASQFGTTSSQANQAFEELIIANEKVQVAQVKIADSQLDDNCVYIMLIPDMTKRISKTSNYFSADESIFFLSTDEKRSLIELIDSTHSRIMTVENRIIDPKIVRFSINATVKLFDRYNEEDVYQNALEKISEYLISFNRRDMLPVSDIVAVLEDVEGIDSVSVFFDADKNNEAIYGKGNFGIDAYGDIILNRKVSSNGGTAYEMKDIYPLFRGPFTTVNGNVIGTYENLKSISAFNMSIVGITDNSRLAKENAIS